MRFRHMFGGRHEQSNTEPSIVSSAFASEYNTLALSEQDRSYGKESVISDLKLFDTADEKYQLPYQIIGNIVTAKKVFVVLHGGPGASITEKQLAPFIAAIQSGEISAGDIAIVVYNQRAAGNGDVTSIYTDEDTEAEPLDEVTPQQHVEDFNQFHNDILHGKPVTLLGYSWGSLLSLLIAEKNPKAVENVITYGFTFGEDEETNQRYAQNGLMAKHISMALHRFLRHMPANFDPSSEDAGMKIVNHYRKILQDTPKAAPKNDNEAKNDKANDNEAKNDKANDNEAKNDKANDKARNEALAIATDFGYLHILASNPTIAYKLVGLLPWSVINKFGEKLGMNSLKFGYLALKAFAKDFPELHKNEATNPIKNLGQLALKRLIVVVGEKDLIVGTEPSAKLVKLVNEDNESRNEENKIQTDLIILPNAGHDPSTTGAREAIRDAIIATVNDPEVKKSG